MRINTANFVGQEVTSTLDAGVNSSAGSTVLVNAVIAEVESSGKADRDVRFRDKPGTDKASTHNSTKRLLQLRVFRFRSDEDRNVRVGVFPQREEVLIRRLGFGGVALHRVGSADFEMR